MTFSSSDITLMYDVASMVVAQSDRETLGAELIQHMRILLELESLDEEIEFMRFVNDTEGEEVFPEQDTMAIIHVNTKNILKRNIEKIKVVLVKMDERIRQFRDKIYSS